MSVPLLPGRTPELFMPLRTTAELPGWSVGTGLGLKTAEKSTNWACAVAILATRPTRAMSGIVSLRIRQFLPGIHTAQVIDMDADANAKNARTSLGSLLIPHPGFLVVTG